MSTETKRIDNEVWRRWRSQQESIGKTTWIWSWPRFLMTCAIAILLADAASTLIGWPLLLKVFAVFIGVSNLLWALMRAAMVTSPGKYFLFRMLPAGMFVALVVTNAPLKWKFALVRDEFDEVAARYSAGEQLDVPLTIGSWEIVEINQGYGVNGPVIFWESVGGAGGSGFVRHPEGKGVNTSSVVRLSGHWSWVQED